MSTSSTSPAKPEDDFTTRLEKADQRFTSACADLKKSVERKAVALEELRATPATPSAGTKTLRLSKNEVEKLVGGCEDRCCQEES